MAFHDEAVTSSEFDVVSQRKDKERHPVQRLIIPTILTVLLIGVPSLWQTVVTGVLLLGVLGLESAQGRLVLVKIGAAERRA